MKNIAIFFLFSSFFISFGYAQPAKNSKTKSLKTDSLAIHDSLLREVPAVQSVMNEDLTVNGKTVLNDLNAAWAKPSLKVTNRHPIVAKASPTANALLSVMENASANESIQTYDFVVREGSSVGNDFLSYMKGANISSTTLSHFQLKSWMKMYPAQCQVELGSGAKTLLRTKYLLRTLGEVSIGVSIGADTLKYGIPLHFLGTYENTDPLYLIRYNRGSNKSDLRMNIGDDSSGDDRFEIGTSTINLYKDWYPKFTVLNNGNVGIGIDQPQYKLDVRGDMRATGLKIVSISNFPDYVFAPDYILPSLNQVEQYIKEKGHLPDIPSAEEVKRDGVDIVELQVKLLQKIEELTLYILEQDKKIKALEEGLK